MFNKKNCFFIVLLSLVCLSVIEGCNNLPFRPSQKKDGKQYGVTESFRHRWWHYYERALSFADGGFFGDAEADLREAIRMRKDDKWRARTYGMHFIDYFPHCELGVIKYKQGGQLEESINELETALKTAKNAKAEYYLDLARKTLIEKEQSDKKPPEIRIDSPEANFRTNAFSVSIKGIVIDDTFVRHITVNGKRVRIDVSAKEICFNEEVSLNPGENKITVEAADLTEKSSEPQIINIYADRMGPIISVDRSDNDPNAKTGVVYAFDDSGLTEVTINGRMFLCNKNTSVQIPEAFPLQSDTKRLVITAKDVPGNITSAEIDLSELSKASHRSNLLAQNSHSEDSIRSDSPGIMLAEPDNSFAAPVIKLHKPETERISYLDYVVIDGEIEGDVESISAEKAVIIEGKTVSTKDYEPFTGNRLPKTSAKKCYFNFLIDLEKNEAAQNVIEIRVGGPALANPKRITVNWRQPNALKEKSRLKMAVCNFFNKDDKKISNSFEEYLLRAMRIHKRFYNPQYLRLAPGDLDEANALQIAKKRGFDCILFGNISHEKNSVHIYVWLQDAQTEELIVGNIDVYENSLNTLDELDLLSQVMNYKLTDELPLVKGTVEEVKSKNTVSVSIGSREKVKEGMRLLVYELNPRDNTLGEAKIEEVVDEKKSEADLLKGKQHKKIKTGDYVVTR